MPFTSDARMTGVRGAIDLRHVASNYLIDLNLQGHADGLYKIKPTSGRFGDRPKVRFAEKSIELPALLIHRLAECWNRVCAHPNAELIFTTAHFSTKQRYQTSLPENERFRFALPGVPPTARMQDLARFLMGISLQLILRHEWAHIARGLHSSNGDHLMEC